jgi:hypothetical protein
MKTHIKTLLCGIDGNSPLFLKDCDTAGSPIQCMEKAFTDDYVLIIIQFARQPMKYQDALIELCAALKRHPRTKSIPIAAILTAIHRRLLEKLNNISVEYAKIVSDSLNEADIRNLTATNSVSCLLARLCPYLEYQPIDPIREIVVCRAYFSRLLLSGNRLNQTCYQPDFQNCPYFQLPQFSKQGIDQNL